MGFQWMAPFFGGPNPAPLNPLRSMATAAIPMKNDEEEALDWSDVALSMVGGEHVTYADLLAAVARKKSER